MLVSLSFWSILFLKKSGLIFLNLMFLVFHFLVYAFYLCARFIFGIIFVTILLSHASCDISQGMLSYQ